MGIIGGIILAGVVIWIVGVLAYSIRPAAPM